ncbi:TPA: alanine dehydrogenase [Staphylococcus aureus]|nr:alanine dehydrogenase [Staphylococcus aureus]
MKIGIPREIKNNENRVGLSPSGVHALVESGHTVLVETNAGSGSFFEDVDYKEAGAEIVAEQAKVWDVDMVIKVKEPLESEYPYFKEGLVLFTYLHLANEEKLTQALIDRKVISIAYETVQLPDRSLPLLSPMSEVAGRMSAQVGAEFLQKLNGGMGILLGGVPGVPKGKVTIIGGGQAGTNAAKIALGLGAVLIPGAKAPRLVTEDMIKQMKNGSVIIDIAIDQGGIFETTDKITTHDNPTYIKHGVVHYTVANMPGAVPRTSTLALNNATLPYALMLANKGYREAFKSNQPLSLGLNTYKGHVTNKGVAEAFEMEYKSVEEALQL